MRLSSLLGVVLSLGSVEGRASIDGFRYVPGDYRANQARDWGTTVEDDRANAARESLDAWYDRWNDRARAEAAEWQRNRPPVSCSSHLRTEASPPKPEEAIAPRPPAAPPAPPRPSKHDLLRDEIAIAADRFVWPFPWEAEAIAARFPHLDTARSARLAQALHSTGDDDDAVLLAALEGGRNLPLVRRMDFWMFFVDRARPRSIDARHELWSSIVGDVTRHPRSVFARAVALLVLHCSRLKEQNPSSPLLFVLRQFLQR